jgi:phosphohistidine phosphatase
MIHLLLLRHAKAVPHSDDDFERGLTDRGLRDAARIGRFMAAHGLTPDRALASDARRAAQTLAAVLRELPEPPRPALDRALYLASPAAILAVIRATPPQFRTLLIVGHNPGIAQVAWELTGAGDASLRRRLEEGFPTSALAALDFAAPDWRAVAPGAGSLGAFASGRT